MPPVPIMVNKRQVNLNRLIGFSKELILLLSLNCIFEISSDSRRQALSE